MKQFLSAHINVQSNPLMATVVFTVDDSIFDVSQQMVNQSFLVLLIFDCPHYHYTFMFYCNVGYENLVNLTTFERSLAEDV
jgi:hypothetical protein